MEKFDLAIVGASLAGNYLCYLLSNSDLKIAVIEEHKEIGLPFQCAGIVSQKLSKLVDLPHEIVLNRVKTAKIIGPTGVYIKLSGNDRPYIIDRIAFDCLFFNKTKTSENIIYFLGEKFKNFEYKRDNHQKYILIETSERKIKVRMLIGCDGPSSSIASLLGIKNKNLYATQIRIKARFNEDEAVMFFDKRWKELFGWIVPEGQQIYRIGIACSKNIANNFRIFLNKVNINFQQKIDQQGGLIPYGLMNRLSFDNIFLLGDSACQVKSSTGGGIIMLLIAAKYAANCIRKCFAYDKFSKKTIQKYYENPCRSIVGRELKIHYLIRSILERFTANDFYKLFQIIKSTKIENKISLYGDMDFPKAFLFQLLKVPFVLSFFFKFILKNPKFIFRILKVLMH
ncbi:MAG: NAD(P)/FAD-dependent oxidoreductase [Candidatus Odinarchaeota archaeon]